MSVGRTTDDAGNVVERYNYDPYGGTEIATVTFYHDHDLDGDIDASDVAHYDWCTSSGFPERAQDPMCVFVHNRDGDYELTAADGTLFAAYVASQEYNSNGAPAPEEWERLRTAYLDANNDQLINLYDWYGLQICEGVTTSTGGMNDHLCLFLYDLDGDGDVDLNEGQQGCNLFTGRWGTPGDAHPGQATGSHFGNPFMWTGQRYDAPTGLYHFLFRSYSPSLGRWLQRDPIGYVDGMHLYQYAASMPLRFVDFFGLQSCALLIDRLEKQRAQKQRAEQHTGEIFDFANYVANLANEATERFGRVESTLRKAVTHLKTMETSLETTDTTIELNNSHGTAGLGGKEERAANAGLKLSKFLTKHSSIIRQKNKIARIRSQYHTAKWKMNVLNKMADAAWSAASWSLDVKESVQEEYSRQWSFLFRGHCHYEMVKYLTERFRQRQPSPVLREPSDEGPLYDEGFVPCQDQ